MKTRWMRRAARLSVVVLAASLALSGWSAPVAAQTNSGANPAQQATTPGVKLVEKMPDAAPPRPFTFPTPVSKTLPNGLRVFVVSAQARGANVPVDPAVSVELLIRNAGSVRDPQGQAGPGRVHGGPAAAGHREAHGPGDRRGD